MAQEWAANTEKTGPLPLYSAIPNQYSQEQPVVSAHVTHAHHQHGLPASLLPTSLTHPFHHISCPHLPTSPPPTSLPTLIPTSPAPPPQVVTQPTAVVMAYQPPPSTTKLPVYALFTSLLVTLVFVGFCCFIPGIFCLIPAVATAIHVSLQQSRLHWRAHACLFVC